MNDIRRTILWVIFGFSMVLLWDQWQVHNGHQATFFPKATPTTAAAPAAAGKTNGTVPAPGAAQSTGATPPAAGAPPAAARGRVTGTTAVWAPSRRHGLTTRHPAPPPGRRASASRPPPT